MTESGESETPAAQNIASILHASGNTENITEATDVAARVFEALRIRLSSVLGNGGYSTLLKRALRLTHPDFPWLGGAIADSGGGPPTGRVPVESGTSAVETVRGYSALLARLTGLLGTFVGEELTNRLLVAVWQDLKSAPAEDSTGEMSRGKDDL